jgi:hypothetical protein
MAMASTTTYPVTEEEQDVGTLSPAASFANAKLRRKVAVNSLDSLSPLSDARIEKIMIPRAPIRRLRAAHPAITGTAREFESRLVDIFPELADVEPEEIERTLRRMRRKEDIEP